MHHASASGRARIFGLLLAVALAALWLLWPKRVGEDVLPETAPARPTASDPLEGDGPSLKGLAPAPDDETPVWLEIRAVEKDTRKPIAHTELMFTFTKIGEQPGVFVARTTDEHGEVRLGPLGREAIGTLQVSAASRVHRPTPKPTPLAHTSRDTLTATVVLDPGARVAGRVELPDGVPASAVRVTLRVGLSEYGHLDLGDDGSFSRAGLEKAAVFVQAVAAWDGKRWWAEYRNGQPETDIMLELSPLRPGDPGLVRIRVEDEHGTPQHARVGLEYRNDSIQGGDVPRYAGPTAEFEYRHYDDVKFLFRAEPVDAAFGDVLVEASAADIDVVIVLPPARTLRGRIVDPEGHPAAGIEVKVHPVDAAGKRLAWSRHATTTDAQGAFVFARLGPRRYALTLAPPKTYMTPVPRVVGANEDDIEITLSTGNKVVVLVHDKDGGPVDATVEVLRVTSDGAASVCKAATDKGIARLHGVPSDGNLDLVVRPAKRDVIGHFEEKWKPRDMTVVLPAAHAISGILYDGNNRVVPDAYVVAKGIEMPHGGMLPRRGQDGGIFFHVLGTKSGPDGAFRIGGLRPGRYTLHPHGKDKSALTVASNTHDIKLHTYRNVRVTFRIVGLKPFDRGTLALFQSDGKQKTPARIDAQGRVSVEVREGAQVSVWIAGLVLGRYVWHRHPSASAEEIEVRVLQGGTVTGQLVVPSGVDKDDLSFHAYGPLRRFAFEGKAPGELPLTWNKKTDEFTVRGVPPEGASILVMGSKGNEFYTAERNIEPGEDVVLKVKVQKGH